MLTRTLPNPSLLPEAGLFWAEECGGGYLIKDLAER